jgi:hypothetical protein
MPHKSAPTRNPSLTSPILWVTLLLFTGLNIFLALNRHSHGSRYTYHGELWADRAGYFVYLPATFQLGFDAKEYPEGLDSLTGHGFNLEGESMVTKYTCGVAMLQAPIYLMAHALSSITGSAAPPFGVLDHYVVDFTAAITLSLGLLFLYLMLCQTRGKGFTAGALFTLYGATGLLYYTIVDPGMSHVYSFMLFAFFLLILSRIVPGRIPTWTLVAIGLTAGWIVLIRPTNVVFLCAALVVAPSQRSSLRSKASMFLGLRPVVIMFISALLIWTPQLLYWKTTFGQWVVWSYEGEGFANWSSPVLARFLFSTNNGLLPYAPIFLIFIWGCVKLWRSGERLAAGTTIGAFVLICYIGASWWVWHFGCGFGSRTLVEYSALFCTPYLAWLKWSQTKWGKVITWTIAVTLMLFEIKLVYSYGDCWFTGDWDWHIFAELVFGPTK